jgi:hypothetical protein
MQNTVLVSYKFSVTTIWLILGFEHISDEYI